MLVGLLHLTSGEYFPTFLNGNSFLSSLFTKNHHLSLSRMFSQWVLWMQSSRSSIVAQAIRNMLTAGTQGQPPQDRGHAAS